MADEIKNTNEIEELDSASVVEEVEIVTLTDEEGNDSEFEIIGRMTLNNNDYIALMAADNDEDYLILRREVEENGEETYVTIEDDDEFEAVASAFDEEFMSEIDFDLGISTEGDND